MSDIKITSTTDRLDVDDMALTKAVYRAVVPATFILCCIAFFLNCMILVLVKWLRRPFSNTIVLTVALATADCWACSMFGASYIVLSYLPIVAGVYVSQCISLALEALKFSAVITSVLHLDLLAVSHYLAIAYPADHRRYLSLFRIKILIAMFFIVPPVVLLTVFGSIPGQSFQSIDCDRNDFYFHYAFRVALFACIFVVPFGLIAILYVCVLRKLEELNKQRKRWRSLANHLAVAVTAINLSSGRVGRDDSLSVQGESPLPSPCGRAISNDRQSLSNALLSPPSFRRRASPRASLVSLGLQIRARFSMSAASPVRDAETVKSMQRKKRTLLTTLMMVSSFLVGWLPAGLVFVLTCNDGFLAPVLQQYPMAGLALGGTTNLLIVVKYLGNPVIYAFRVPEIQKAFKKFCACE